MHAKIVDTLRLEALIQKPIDITGLKPWQGTGIAVVWTVELTIMLAEQAVIDVVHWKMVTLVHLVGTWMPLVDMDMIAITPLDGKLVTGYALGMFTKIYVTKFTKIYAAFSCIGIGLRLQTERNYN